MSWLLFMDESGHDHKQMPYEVRGGVALHAKKLWPFEQAWRQLELSAFGAELALYKKEIKGSKLADKDRFKWAAQAPPMPGDQRRKHCLGFLTKGLEKKPPNRQEFTAYGQASLEMARGVFQLLRDHEAVLFAAAIPRGVRAFSLYLDFRNVLAVRCTVIEEKRCGNLIRPICEKEFCSTLSRA
jgi:hypothetical protein